VINRRSVTLAAAGLLALVVLLALASVAAAALPASASADEAATPDLIERDLQRDRIEKPEAALNQAYALLQPSRLPRAYRSDTPWDGTLALLQLRRDARRLPRGATRSRVEKLLRSSTASCDTESTEVPNTRETGHFFVAWNTIGAGLTVDDYAQSLEEVWTEEISHFGWAAPPVYTPDPPPNHLYHVRLDNLGGGLYGFVSSSGTHAGLVGDNPHTAWSDQDAYASCMVLNSDYAGFPSSPQGSLDSTTAHEFNHSIQFGYGALSGGPTEPDAAFVEGGATWMEDEAQDTANDNYNYLWPNFNESMGEYDGGGFPYPYWITFRGMTERFGTTVPGGGEQVMQDFWEETSKGTSHNIGALKVGLSRKGTNLPQAFHDYAVAVRFRKGCTAVGYPFCLDEGPDYPTFPASDPNFLHTVALGASIDRAIEDDYAIEWVDLPASGGPYSVTLDNTSLGGVLRGTVVCDTGSTIRRWPLSDTASTGHLVQTVAGIDPAAASCTKTSLAVTNETETAQNPTGFNDRAYRVSATATSGLSGNVLTVSKDGAGAGTVTSDVAGINCGADCAEGYASGTVVLTAAPATGSTFTGWAGSAGCTGTSTCSVTMDATKHAIATFAPAAPPADSTAPETSISFVRPLTNDATPELGFASNEPASTFECSIDSSAFAACSSPHTAGTLSDGDHTFEVRAIDASNNVDATPEPRDFTVDTAAPETTITGGPGETTTSSSATFTFSGSGDTALFRCALDSGPFEKCASPSTVFGLSMGDHTFEAQSIDAAGNADATPATANFSRVAATTTTTPTDATPTQPTLPDPIAQLDKVKPTIGSLRLSARRFRAARAGKALVAAVGTRVRYVLSEAATLTVTVERLRKTRTGGRRYVRERGKVTVKAAAGPGAFTYRGRLGRRALKPGTYRMVLVAKDKAGNKSTTKRASFRIVR